ncbi:hypothetical protein SAMN05216275_14144 [Streptosporangium canum]|uniref:Uncharacterized protein n=1 Tax=Streptosporangium canum TaxID=324952 RepID=A0A1I4DJR5_9ACTN|nr:hypothetical protein [Streptosporangium canum]SFK92246.1 hypothetical protein SAMN05216275_14144 [Streptosporangium canum]
MAEIPEEEWDLLELFANLRVRFWTCLNQAHKAVTWTGDLASCDTCGLTSEMTSRYRELVRQHERREITRHIRAIPEDDEPLRTATRKFIDRHPRLREGTSIVAVLLAVADEIEGADQ